jgi:hypothetical protein
MEKTLQAKSATLVCGALLASITALTDTVDAAPVAIGIDTFVHATGSTQAFSRIIGTHQFGTQGQVMGAPPYTITVSSNPSQRPGWQYELMVNYTAYDPGYFIPFGIDRLTLDLNGIKPDGAPDPIIAINVKHIDGSTYTSGQNSFTGTSIHVDVAIAEVIAPGSNNIIIVQWNQFPAPGGLALLGVAGVLGGRRRRS